jgi:hypothetical protein
VTSQAARVFARRLKAVLGLRGGRGRSAGAYVTVGIGLPCSLVIGLSSCKTTGASHPSPESCIQIAGDSGLKPDSTLTVRRVLGDAARTQRPSETSIAAWLAFAEARLLFQWSQRMARPTLGVTNQGSRRGGEVRWCLGDESSSFFVLSRAGDGPPHVAGMLASAVSSIRWSSRDSLSIGFAHATNVELDVLFRRMRTLTSVFQSSPLRPTVVLLFDDSSSLRRAFALRFRDGRAGDYSFTIENGPSVALIARQSSRYSPHELVHLAATFRRVSALRRGMEAPYVLEEALAVALGGSSGRSLSELAQLQREAHDDTHGLFGAPDTSRILGPRGAAMITRLRLAAMYRAVLRRCASVPAGLLEVNQNHALFHLADVAMMATGLTRKQLSAELDQELGMPDDSLWLALERGGSRNCQMPP